MSAIGLLALVVSLLWTIPWSDLRAQSESVPSEAQIFSEPTNSSSIAMEANQNLIGVVNPDDDSVSVIGNPEGTPSVNKKITVGHEPQGIAIDTKQAISQAYLPLMWSVLSPLASTTSIA